MKTPGRKALKELISEAEYEQHVCSILASLLYNLKDDVLRARVLRQVGFLADKEEA